MINIETLSFKRLTTEYFYKKLISNRSFLLFGPRQTGKSTLLETIFDRFPAHQQLKYYFQLSATRQKIEADPEIILREIQAFKSKTPIFLFIDEIQKIPQVLDILQFLLDKKKIILAASGSSARKMRTLGANWLPGRVELDFFYPLVWQESGIKTSPSLFEQSLLYGSLPGIFSISDVESRSQLLDTYTQLYLEEEIRVEAHIRNLPKFAKFLQLAALESGTAPNFSKLANQVGVSHTTIAHYYQILEDTLVVHRIDAFGNSRQQVIRSPRYLFFDLGVRNAAAKIGHSPGLLTLQIGPLFEQFVILEVIARMSKIAKIQYWRTKTGQEVDLILESKSTATRIAIEIKATRRPTEHDLQGLDAFLAQYDCSASYLICQVERAQKIGPHQVIPWQEFDVSSLFD